MRIRSKVGISLPGWKTLISSWFIRFLFPLSWPKRFGCRRVFDAPFQSLVQKFHVQAKRPHLLDQHVEGFRNAGLEIVLAAHDRLVHFGAARHVVRLNGKDFLQRVSRAVRLERPHFHFAEALSAELRLAAQWLLGNEAVWSDRTG